MPPTHLRRAARDRIVEREVMKLEQRATASRPAARAQRDLVVMSLLVRPDAGRGAARRLSSG